MVNLRLRTQYIFGTGAVEYLETFLKINKFEKVMLLYGSHAIKNNGLFDEIVRIFKKTEVKWVEYSGIRPNPLDTDINKAAEFGRANKVEVIIAAGGGSVIDSAKLISTLIANPEAKDLRELYEDSHLAKNMPLPIVSIPTTAGTGSENNGGSVINFTDEAQVSKRAMHNNNATPIVCLEDSKFIASANNWQIASGIFDAFTHQIEQYFGLEVFAWTREYLFANMRNLWNFAMPFVLNHDNKVARDNIMWTTTMSLNPLSSFNSDGDWNIHTIEHAISAKWNVTHGAGLALVMPTYIRLRAQQSAEYRDKVLYLAREVFNTDSVEGLIAVIVEWIKELGLPTKWSDFKEIGKKPSEHELVWLAEHAVNNSKWQTIQLSQAFILAILNAIPE